MKSAEWIRLARNISRPISTKIANEQKRNAILQNFVRWNSK